MTAHMRPKSIATSMRLTIPRTTGPLTDELLLAIGDMLFVDMADKRIHIPQIVRVAVCPPAHGYLVAAMAAIIIILATAKQCLDAW